MVTVNLKEHGLVNGDVGDVIEVFKDYVTMVCDRFPEKKFDIVPHEWQQIEYIDWEENVIGSYTQIPLKLSWAITVHKSQGLTLDSVCVNITKGMQVSMIYVALSRCKTFEGLFVNKIY